MSSVEQYTAQATATAMCNTYTSSYIPLQVIEQGYVTGVATTTIPGSVDLFKQQETEQCQSVLVSLQLPALLVFVLVHFMLAFSPNTVCSERYDHCWRDDKFVHLSCGSQNNCLC